MHLRMAIRAALIAIAAFPVPASAGSYLITGAWSGFTDGGNDEFGEFGSPSQHIAAGIPVYGQIYVRTAGLDVQQLDRVNNPGLDSYDLSHLGDIVFSITLNGHTQTVASTAIGEYAVIQFNPVLYGTFSQEFWLEPSSIQRHDAGGHLIEANNVEFGVRSATPFLILSQLNQSFSYSANPDLIGGFYGHWYLDNGVATEGTQINYTVDNLIVNSVSAVPEPSTWAFLLFGLATIGATLRRRRARPALGLAARAPMTHMGIPWRDVSPT